MLKTFTKSIFSSLSSQSIKVIFSNILNIIILTKLFISPPLSLSVCMLCIKCYKVYQVWQITSANINYGKPACWMFDSKLLLHRLLWMTYYLSVTWKQCYTNRSKHPEDATVPALSKNWLIYYSLQWACTQKG